MGSNPASASAINGNWQIIMISTRLVRMDFLIFILSQTSV
ncbi:hypothetical protein LEP1GSC202_3406 [Leptospira yanagawae serovar Saopaulo str. Sao Paulo = ATCC 700523]|uniref:Uncharacterized protein n=1 Tax=Leptospira yanagawae serovar Saopaulo str. Sao Paulo = ATCC 700523 TaxID=1249483 RepID=A0A5E8HD51_9LEPT|nr:hypothetical protein LEP1GSC202_3406 [Leptospira yanagawae serovar Saopaulo str. Sao Paulo = ATCC 700523]